MASCPHVKYGSLTVVTYSEKFEVTNETRFGVDKALAQAKADGTLNELNKYPTCAPVTCSKYNFVKELDCAVFYEQNRMRQFPKSWLQRLVAFKYAPENQMFLKTLTKDEIDVDRMIWRLEDAITKLAIKEA